MRKKKKNTLEYPGIKPDGLVHKPDTLGHILVRYLGTGPPGIYALTTYPTKHALETLVMLINNIVRLRQSESTLADKNIGTM